MPWNGSVVSVPVIVVGVVKHSSWMGTAHKSRWDEDEMVQLIRVDVTFENVIKSDINSDNGEVFFYRSLRASEGPPRLGMIGEGGTWKPGDRELFFLQKEQGHLRTICDTFRNCVIPVLTGSHPSFRRSPNPIEDIARILLTKGDGCSDYQMAAAVKINAGLVALFSKEVAVQHLRILAGENAREIRKEACYQLADLGQPCKQ